MSVQLAVIPVAGRGTRLLPLTKSQPKEMLPVGRKPVVQYVVEELSHCGVNRMLFITGPGKTAIENHFDIDAELIENLRMTGKEDLLEELAFERANVEYFYTRQRRQLGLGHAVLCAQPVVNDQSFVVALGDSMLGMHAKATVVKRMIDVFESENADAVIALEEVPWDEVVRYGIARPADKVAPVFQMSDMIEKPSVEEAPSNLACAARYVFKSSIFDYLKQTRPGKNGEIQLTDAIRALIADGGKVLGICVRYEERRFDIGNFQSYFRAFMEYALADPTYGEDLRNHLKKIL